MGTPDGSSQRGDPPPDATEAARSHRHMSEPGQRQTGRCRGESVPWHRFAKLRRVRRAFASDIMPGVVMTVTDFLDALEIYVPETRPMVDEHLEVHACVLLHVLTEPT